MKTPTLTIDDVTYTACSPKMGLWRKVLQFKSQRRQRAQKVKAMLESLAALKESDGTDEQLETLLDEINTQLEETRQFTTDAMTEIILSAFPEIQTIDDMLLKDVPATYELINTWLELILSGRLSELPNAETPAER